MKQQDQHNRILFLLASFMDGIVAVSATKASTATAPSSSDWEKLQLALQPLLQHFASGASLADALGWSSLPIAQRYGIYLGILTFVSTVSAVLLLLYCGGSFARIQEQEADGGGPLRSSPAELSASRPLLYEELLLVRQRLMQSYISDEAAVTNESKLTLLTRRLSNVAPAPTDEIYKRHYTEAYRQCQDRPGGPTLSGRPEARYEAFARAYAGCCDGRLVEATAYRRSYGRLYERIVAPDHTTEAAYAELFTERPRDIVGRHVRLEALEEDRHAAALWASTNGSPTRDYHKSYDPYDVWCFCENGPFDSVEALRQSFLFRSMKSPTTAAFAIRASADTSPSGGLLGVVLLCRDVPQNLSIQMQLPIMSPGYPLTSKECLEACFLLLDRVFFGYSYRRVDCWVDPLDVPGRQFVSRHLGMTSEGCLYKNRILKEANRDDHVYALLNSDWNVASTATNASNRSRSVRAVLFQRLYGAAAWRADQRNERVEGEREAQARGLKEQSDRIEQCEIANESTANDKDKNA